MVQAGRARCCAPVGASFRGLESWLRPRASRIANEIGEDGIPLDLVYAVAGGDECSPVPHVRSRTALHVSNIHRMLRFS